MKPFEAKCWFLILIFFAFLFFPVERIRRKKESGRQRWSPTSPSALFLLCKSISPLQGRVGVHRGQPGWGVMGLRSILNPARSTAPLELRAQSSERNQYRERETDVGSPNLALSLQARWPPTHTRSYALTHIQIHTDIQLCYCIFRTLMTSIHLHTHVFVCLVFLKAMLFWSNFYNPNRPQLFFTEDGKGPRFVFPPLYLCPSMSPSTSVWQDKKTFKHIKHLQGWTSSPEQVIVYSGARLDRGKQLDHFLLCSTTLHQKVTLPLL